MNEAYRCYTVWGAASKVAHLEEHYGELLTTKSLATTSRMVAAEADGSAERVAVDMSTVVKVAHAIAVEMEVSGLLRKLMTLALENAGAQRGIFAHERDGGLVVEAEAGVDRVHRCDRKESGPFRAGQRRHDLPGRNRGASSRRTGEAVARASGA